MEAIVHRKESIVFTAIDVMNEFGVQALSTREVAKREGVTEGAIFKHYSKKTDLMMAVLDFYAKYDKDIYASLIKKNLSPKDAIMYYFELYATYYENYPAITSIAQAFDELRYHSELEQKVKDIIKIRVDCVKNLIEKGQECGDIRIELDKVALADIIIGTFHGICLKWRMGNYKFSLKDNSLSAIQMILEAF